MKDHSRTIGKVNAYIQAFVRARSVATVCELEKYLVQLYECEQFSDIKVGPLLKLVC